MESSYKYNDHLGLPTEIVTILSSCYESVNGKCPCGLEFSPSEGLIPRGVVCPSDVNDVRLVVVGQNPSCPTEEEKSEYAAASSMGSSDEERKRLFIQAMAACCKDCFRTPEMPYHRTLLEFLDGVFLNITREEYLKKIYFTEVLKCSTERGLKLDSRKLRGPTKSCVEKYLLKELEFFPKTKVILALGDEAKKALCRYYKKQLPILPIMHPRSRDPTRRMEDYKIKQEKLRELLSGEDLRFEKTGQQEIDQTKSSSSDKPNRPYQFRDNGPDSNAEKLIFGLLKDEPEGLPIEKIESYCQSKRPRIAGAYIGHLRRDWETRRIYDKEGNLVEVRAFGELSKRGEDRMVKILKSKGQINFLPTELKKKIIARASEA